MQSGRNCSASPPDRRAPRRTSRAAANSRPDVGHHRDVVGPVAGERVDGTALCDAVAVSVDATNASKAVMNNRLAVQDALNRG
jgi:hypothetical protein